jgi:hypothetical protein
LAQRIDIALKLRSGGLWTRLSSHASGRRSGDQFNVYICDRFVIPTLTPRQQQDIGDGKLLLDQMTKYFIRRHLSYRFMAYPSGAEALAVERRLRAGQSPAGRPYLNPLWAPGWVATLWSRHRCRTIGNATRRPSPALSLISRPQCLCRVHRKGYLDGYAAVTRRAKPQATPLDTPRATRTGTPPGPPAATGELR